MEKNQVKVVVPLYRSDLSAEEERSLRHNLDVLHRYPVVLLVPEGLDTSALEARYPQCATLRVSDRWLGTKCGIAGYNRMMMSPDFYALFPDTEYLLICQTDCWIFRDELTAWCARGYDYAGAPSPRKPVYDLWPARWYLALRRRLTRGAILRQDLLGKVYNGGLSLRRVERFRTAAIACSAEAAGFLARNHYRYNEDVFWSLVPEGFRYPPFDEALGFSFDVKPARCYRLAEGRLPFGCHGWYKTPYREFWKDFIG